MKHLLIHAALLGGIASILNAKDTGGGSGSDKKPDTKAKAEPEPASTGRGVTATTGLHGSFTDPAVQRDRQAKLAERTLADQRSRRAAALAAETDTELTTVEHSGKRTGEPDKPDEMEDLKVGEAYKTHGVETTDVERHTLAGPQVVDQRVTNPVPDVDAAAALAAQPEGQRADPRLAAGASLTGTRAQQVDAAKAAEAAGGVNPADVKSPVQEGDVALTDGTTGKVSENPQENGPGHTSL